MEGRSNHFEGLSTPFRTFVALFNDGHFWESHEVLEKPWREYRSNFYKGLIIYASAFVHAQRGNPRGVRKQMVKAAGYLEEYRPFYLGVDVERLLMHLHRCLAWVQGSEPPTGEALASSFPYDTIVLDPSRVRGDEVELSGG